MPPTRKPKPLEFPMQFTQCLRRVIGRRSYKENLHSVMPYFREALKAMALRHSYRPPPEEAIEKQALDLMKLAAEFPVWHRKHNIRRQCRNAANLRWAKERQRQLTDKRIKLLDLISKRVNAPSQPNRTLALLAVMMIACLLLTVEHLLSPQPRRRNGLGCARNVPYQTRICAVETADESWERALMNIG
jgi:hypothetical protein